MKDFGIKFLFSLGLLAFIVVATVNLSLNIFPNKKSIPDAGNPTRPGIDRSLISFETGEDVKRFEALAKSRLYSSGPGHISIEDAMKSYLKENKK
jgi:hypothetical protein